MASLKNIKIKIGSVKKTATVTRAMEAVSAVKMRKSQERALSGRAYAAAALSILERLSGTGEAGHHPLMIDLRNQSLQTVAIVVTSDKGLAGSLNSAVIRATEQELAKGYFVKKDMKIIAIGRRGADYFASRDFNVAMRRENVSDDVSEADLRAVTDQLLSWHAAGDIGACFIVYTNFISTFEQKPVVRQVIPITPDMIHEMVRGIRPAKGKYAPKHDAEENARPSVYTIEPDAGSVLAELMPKLVNIAVFHALLEAKASEHSARMVAMKSATDKAKEMASDLTRMFNKSRQAAITREMSEITSGIESMR